MEFTSCHFNVCHSPSAYCLVKSHDFNASPFFHRYMSAPVFPSIQIQFILAILGNFRRTTLLFFQKFQAIKQKLIGRNRNLCRDSVLRYICRPKIHVSLKELGAQSFQLLSSFRYENFLCVC
jgi:hypothetical protein